MIYLDNAATSFFKPESTIKKVVEYLHSPGNPGRGVNIQSLNASSIVLDARMKVAKFFDFDDFTRVIWTSGITESLNVVIKGLIKKEDHVITTYLEHNSALRPLYKVGCELSITDGTIDEIKKCIKKNTKAIILNHISNVTGEIEDLYEIGRFAKENKLLFIVDTAQSAGHIKISIKDMNISVLCFTGHKGLLSMQGIGGIVINTDKFIEPLKVGGTGIKTFEKEAPLEYPEHLEAGTLNLPGIVSINSSIDYINEYGIENINQYEMKLKNKFYEFLSNEKKIKILENKNKKATAIVSFIVDGIDSNFIGDYLSNEYKIAIRTGGQCAPLVHEHFKISQSARVSFGLNNKEEDVDILISALKEIIC